MKKLSLLLITCIMILMIGGCDANKIQPVKLPALQNTYDVFLQTDWGMSEEAVKKALNLKEKDCSKLDSKQEGLSEEIYGFSTQMKLLNEEAKVKFNFSDNLRGKGQRLGLFTVTACFETLDINKVTSKLEKELAKTKIERTTNIITSERPLGSIVQIGTKYSSDITCATIKEAPLREKGIARMDEIFGEIAMGYKALPLSEIRITIDETDEQVNVVFFGLPTALINNL